MQERLQKIISRAGLASRRAGEEIILAGRVRVNGHIVTELGAKADLAADTVEVDGRRLVHEAAHYLVLHKPRGVVSTLSDPEGRPTVATLLEGAGTRLYPVGRLDFATSGVLLVTNDGDFANGLLHPRGGVPKTYVVKTKGAMSDDELERWRTGIRLEDGMTLPADVHFLRHDDGKTWFEVTLREGRNQQIRRMGEATGFPVMRLARVSFAGITSEGLRPGQWRSLSVEELMHLREDFGVPKKIRGAALGGIHQGVAGNPKPRAPRTGDRRLHPQELPDDQVPLDVSPSPCTQGAEGRGTEGDEGRRRTERSHPSHARRRRTEGTEDVSRRRRAERSHPSRRRRTAGASR